MPSFFSSPYDFDARYEKLAAIAQLPDSEKKLNDLNKFIAEEEDLLSAMSPPKTRSAPLTAAKSQIAKLEALLVAPDEDKIQPRNLGLLFDKLEPYPSRASKMHDEIQTEQAANIMMELAYS